MKYDFIKSLTFEQLKELHSQVGAEMHAKDPVVIEQNQRWAKWQAERDAKAELQEAYSNKVVAALRKILEPGVQLKMKGCKDGVGMREFIRWDDEKNLVCWKIDRGERTNYVTTHFPDKVTKVFKDGKIFPIRSLLS